MPDSEQIINPERVRTEIPGFDELCGGGLLKRRSYLVSGLSGAGKTILGLQYLYNGIIKHGEHGIYVSTEEAPLRVRENMLQFGWDLKKLEEDGKLAIIDARHLKFGASSLDRSVSVESFDMGSLLDKFLLIHDEIAAKRVLVGGAASISYSLGEHSKTRGELMKLSKTLEYMGLTSLITCETIDESGAGRFGFETFITDGTILMSQKRRDNVKVRSIEILQMKGSNHSQSIHPYEITSNGIVVHSNEDIYSS